MNKVFILILSLCTCGCGACKYPLHDQFGIHNANWNPPSEQMVELTDTEVDTIMSDMPALQTIEITGQNKEKYNVRDAVVCCEDSLAR